MAGAIDVGATGDISIAILRRNGTIAVPVYLWTATGWVDLKDLTAGQFSSWVDFRCLGVPAETTGDPNAPPQKYVNLTLSRTNDW